MRRDKIVRGRYEISLKKITGDAHASNSPDIVDDEEEAPDPQMPRVNIFGGLKVVKVIKTVLLGWMIGCQL